MQHESRIASGYIFTDAVATAVVAQRNSDDVRKGFNKVTVNMRVESDATPELLTELALYSPVYDMVSRALPVDFNLTMK